MECPILVNDNNIRCDVAVDVKTHELTDHQCDRAFDFGSVCVGCPLEGTQEAEDARHGYRKLVVQCQCL